MCSVIGSYGKVKNHRAFKKNLLFLYQGEYEDAMMENLYDADMEKQSLEDYYQGKDEPLADWFTKWYHQYLFFCAWNVLDNSHDVEMVLSDVLCKLLETEVTERRQKFKVENGNIKGALAMRVRNASYDLRRRRRPDLPGTLPENEDNRDLAKIIANKECIESLRIFLTNNGLSQELQLLQLMLSYGPGHLSEMAEQMSLSTDEARVLQQRLKRNAKKFLINIGCNGD